MPSGTLVIDTAATFTTAFLMASSSKDKFGSPGQQEYAKDGTPKWLCNVAVTFAAVGQMPPQSDILTITVTCPRDPGLDIDPGSPVSFEGLRVGVSDPEKRDNGSIRGGRQWFQASGIRPAGAQALRPVKADAS
jgi:hypothetical protein